MVSRLDDYIVGQVEAKRAVAIALRNRWRRHHLPASFKSEVIPKNILMIGPTGCGKTEIARRLSALCNAPFIKVEATRFTEVGFHGKDVDHIIRDLVEVAITMVKKHHREEHRDEAKAKAEAIVLDLFGAAGLTPSASGEAETTTGSDGEQQMPSAEGSEEAVVGQSSGGGWLEALQRGDLDDKEVEVEVEGSGGNDAMLSMMGKASTEKKRMPIKEALPLIEEQELARLFDGGDFTKEAIEAVESNGIVFIDEIGERPWRVILIGGSLYYSGTPPFALRRQDLLLQVVPELLLSRRVGGGSAARLAAPHRGFHHQHQVR